MSSHPCRVEEIKARREITRRSFGAFLAAPLLNAQSGDWVSLFNGRDLDGWKPSENLNSWKVIDGALAADGPRSHLFYSGPVRSAMFRNFELEAEVMTQPEANSGIYFHTAFQEKGFPQKGFEVQVNNTAKGEGAYRERKKTGSLYGVRNVYKQFVRDGDWFKLNVLVRGKNIQIRLNGMLVVDFTEATPPVLAEGSERGRLLDRGTFALQCHDPGSKARYRSIRVRPLADGEPTPAGAEAPTVDEAYRDIITLGAKNYPMVDYHVHLKNGLTLEQALARSRRDGIFYGLAVNCGKGFPVEDDASTIKFFETMKDQPCFVAMQAEGREWTQMFSRRAAGLFDYIFTDSMTWTDNRGRRMRTWMPNEVGTITDPREFMDTLVARATGIIDNEPIDIYVNPTFIPDQIAKDYDTLWTEERMKKVLSALVRNGVAMEINDRYKLPSASFIRMGKAMGVKFTFGTNNTGPTDLRRSDYGRQMISECKLTWQDFWAPGAFGLRAVERKGSALKA
ncbi:MAG: DUF1080 domain-containing protein [Acidobacteria bacterium]|nr:DUF1080 domain-containing protein [Acidobacteriota bacterium]